MKVDIDEELQQVLEARAEEKDFGSTEEYINHLLRQVAEKIRDEKKGKDSYSSEQEEEVKKRLEELGYTG
ncbi:MAG: hypothetical protein ABEJ36_06080 [Candidatus Nanosalina sp.]